eukprot:CAMPEP_0113644268 /NCGR_PEP_ID=MMETSP0017_2-20120614/23295_1 /TAXON_ID=2856 /ORGANISM="Cylindrotheca closterium" /LENGTH=71 /DNA_ID=CAMNT_0000555863 /DNA_START=91 /DNA_END=306 /DNA_ORIENTATION=+ /assembly_acc=CAM_ASM_000147
MSDYYASFSDPSTDYFTLRVKLQEDPTLMAWLVPFSSKDNWKKKTCSQKELEVWKQKHKELQEEMDQMRMD